MNGFHALMYHEIIDREGYDRQQYKGIKVKQDYHDVLPEELFALRMNLKNRWPIYMRMDILL